MIAKLVRPMFKANCCIALAIVAALLSPSPCQAAGQSSVAVFNFQMKSKTPDWVWLEKCLADQITTDLSRGAGLSVIARDSMQAIAQEISWAPEMATGHAKHMGLIRKRLRIDYLISGVFSIEGGGLELTGQIVSADERKVLFRKVLSGKIDDVISLQKKLSAELTAWFTKKPAAGILKGLPVWTRSIPALKALYQGMDLYDHGRYAEGWLKFRQASREDRGYVEAQYWVGKMYYFMDRHAHARRALERFVYMDESHPRIADCLTEYLHTYETENVSPQELLDVYDRFCKRFGDELLPGINTDSYSNRLRPKMGRLLLKLHRPEEALAYFDKPVYRFTREDGHYDSIIQQKMLHGAWPGPARAWVLKPGGIDEVGYFIEKGGAFQGQSKNTEYAAGFRRITSGTIKSARWGLVLVPPNGHVIESVHLFPVTKAAKGTVKVTVSKDAEGDIASCTLKLDELIKTGFRVDNLPRAAFLAFKFAVTTDREFEIGSDILSGLRREVKLAKLGPAGVIDVRCLNTGEFRVDLDGRYARTYAGMIGMVDPGEHVLRFSPIDSKGPHDPTTVKVIVKAGQTHRVTASLPWKKSSPWNGWTSGVMIGEDVQDKVPANRTNISVIAQEDAIRVVWAVGGDIWCAQSTDGKHFTKAFRLGLPVSSGWDEYDVHVTRQESGRYVMVFVSTRSARHEHKVYVCWSRDFVNWSAPTIVDVPDGISRYPNCGIFTDNQGRLILSVTSGYSRSKYVVFLASKDTYRWERIGDFKEYTPPSIVQRPDGKYELFTLKGAAIKKNRSGSWKNMELHVLRRTSHDLRKWSKPNEITVIPYANTWAQFASIASVRCENGGIAAACVVNDKVYNFRENDLGVWGTGVAEGGFGACPIAMAYHPRWGNIVAWFSAYWASNGMKRPFSGPHLIRGPVLEGRPYSGIARKTPKTTVVAGPTGPARKPTTPGRLKRIPDTRNLTPNNQPSYPLRTAGRENFSLRGESTTALTARARIATVTSGSLVFHVAMDFTNKDLKYPNVARVDFSGKGDFKTSYTAKRIRLVTTTDDSVFRCRYVVNSVQIKGDGGAYPASLDCYYQGSPRDERLWVKIGSRATGSCYFGRTLYNVIVDDRNSNLQFNDPGQLSVKGDAVSIYKKNPKNAISFHYGQLALVDGVLYETTVSEDAATISAKPYLGKTGQIKINHSRWEAIFHNKDHLIELRGGRDPVSAPVGDYTVVWCTDWERDKNGREQRSDTKGNVDVNGKEMAPVVVVENKVTEIVIGSPMITRLKAVQRGGNIELQAYETDVGGRFLSYFRNPGPLYQSTITIIDSKGKQIAKFKVKSEQGDLVWAIPNGLKGKLTAKVRLSAHSDLDKLEGTTFTIE